MLNASAAQQSNQPDTIVIPHCISVNTNNNITRCEHLLPDDRHHVLSLVKIFLKIRCMTLTLLACHNSQQESTTVATVCSRSVCQCMCMLEGYTTVCIAISFLFLSSFFSFHSLRPILWPNNSLLAWNCKILLYMHSEHLWHWELKVSCVMKKMIMWKISL